MFNYKKFNNVKIITMFFLFISVYFSCRTTDETLQPSEEEPLFMARPKILLESSRTSLPVLLKWESIEGVKSYEVQVSDTMEFNSSLQNWTLRSNSFRLNSVKAGLIYLRIRSVYEGGTSRWSETLILKQEGSEIYLQWDR